MSLWDFYICGIIWCPVYLNVDVNQSTALWYIIPHFNNVMLLSPSAFLSSAVEVYSDRRSFLFLTSSKHWLPLMILFEEHITHCNHVYMHFAFLSVNLGLLSMFNCSTWLILNLLWKIKVKSSQSKSSYFSENRWLTFIKCLSGSNYIECELSKYSFNFWFVWFFLFSFLGCYFFLAINMLKS